MPGKWRNILLVEKVHGIIQLGEKQNNRKARTRDRPLLIWSLLLPGQGGLTRHSSQITMDAVRVCTSRPEVSAGGSAPRWRVSESDGTVRGVPKHISEAQRWRKCSRGGRRKKRKLAERLTQRNDLRISSLRITRVVAKGPQRRDWRW